MGVSKLPKDLKPERWELIFFIVSAALLEIYLTEELTFELAWGRYLHLGFCHLVRTS